MGSGEIALGPCALWGVLLQKIKTPRQICQYGSDSMVSVGGIMVDGGLL